jgi:chlorobactene glucosyltransferase
VKRAFVRAADATALLILCVLTVRLWRNLRFLRRARSLIRLPDALPRVSVLVPARDEARTIVDCIDSLAQQDYPNFEIIALNDQSSDETGALLDEMAARHPNVTVLHGCESPPAGWNGKSYACHRLAVIATGEWLLFTDADTRHTPTSIAHGVAQAEALGADLLSAFPKQLTESWSERLLVSFILDFLTLLGVDLTNLWRGTSGSIAANGQYLLVRAAAYRTVGGHEAVFQALVDDFALAKRIRSKGYKVALVDGTSMLICRMYHDAGEVWAGFSKNILLALETTTAEKRPSWWSAVFAWGYACVFVLPFFWLLLPARKRLLLVEIAWLGVLRGLVNGQFSRPLNEVVTTPLAGWSVMALGLSALLRRRRGTRIRWKGRDYRASD